MFSEHSKLNLHMLSIGRLFIAAALFANLGGCGGGGGSGTGSATSPPAPAPAPVPSPGSISLLAGSIGGAGNIDGMGADVRLAVASLAVDGVGNTYVTGGGCSIRKISRAGVTTTLAGSAYDCGIADGVGSGARFKQILSIAADAAGNVFVGDNNTIRKVTQAGVVTTLAGRAGVAGASDGVGAAGTLGTPSGMAVDGAGNLYIADPYGRTIRKLTSAGLLTTFAGTAFASLFNESTDGIGAAARFNNPNDVAVDGANNVYVRETSDTGLIRKITPAGSVSSLALAFPNPTDAYFARGLAADAAGNLYLAGPKTRTILKATPTGVVTTLAGQPSADSFANAVDGNGPDARFKAPSAVAVDATGNVYVADSDSVRKVSSAGTVTTLAGSPMVLGASNGVGAAAQFGWAQGVAVDSSGTAYVADRDNGSIRKISPAGAVTTLAGPGNLPGKSVDGLGTSASFNHPADIAVDTAGNLYVTEPGISPRLELFFGLGSVIRKITPAGQVTTKAGRTSTFGTDDGMGTAASFGDLQGVAVDDAGNVYVADRYFCIVRKMTPAGLVTTMAGKLGDCQEVDGVGSAARFSRPSKLAVDGAGNVFVSGSGTVRKITPAGVVTTLAGSSLNLGSSDGIGAAASFLVLGAIATDRAGNVFVADVDNFTIRKITPAGVVSTVAGTVKSNGTILGNLPGSLGSITALSIDTHGLLYATTGGAVLKIQLPQ